MCSRHGVCVAGVARWSQSAVVRSARGLLCLPRLCVCVCEGARARTRVFTGVVCLSVCRPVYACSPCQPVYHSKHNDVEARMLCGMSMLPLKKGPRGPAGTLSEGACNHRACIAPRAASCCLVVAVVGGVRVVLL